jgi:hypothetical protein
MSAISIPVEHRLIAEIILRSQGRVDPVGLIDSIVSDYLDRTEGDADIWSLAHAEEVAETNRDDSDQYGDPTKGYYWNRVFLPNGTALLSSYKGQQHRAEIRHEQLVYDGKPSTPSQFASMVANNTSRNAWRDLWVKRPGEPWHAANALRLSV